jgi:serine/threonine protein kinase
MTPERWRRIEAIFHSALQRDPASRGAYLTEACGDDTGLRREVESLLSKDASGLAALDLAPLDVTNPTVTALTPGARLGPYQIEAALGAGGMGQVYQATDTRLGRKVAIKVSQQRFNERLDREARAIASLNHPHVCTLHDVGPNYLVMELVEGETLSSRLRKGPLPLESVARYGGEIAEALAAAHARGIVHRDLKPGNIMLTKSGVKVLDFGLAKFARSEGAEAGPDLTASHAIIGTPAYMAPEQLQGQQAGVPADIFALGLVLYEMAIGERAFKGDTAGALLAAILQSHRTLDRLAPPAFAHVVERCLEHDPEKRWQNAQDAQLELQWAVTHTPPAAAARNPPNRISVAILAAVAALAIAMAAFLYWRTRHAISPAEPWLSQVVRLTHDAGLTTDPDLSLDAKLLAYSSDRASASAGQSNLDIWVQQIAGGEPIRLTHDTADDHEPAFSPDGTQIAFRSERSGGGIYVIPALGGEERLIAPGGHRPKFSPDGQWVAYWTGRPVTSLRVQGSKTFVVRSTGGTPIPVAPELDTASFPVWSPDGKRLLFRAGDVFDQHTWRMAPVQGGPSREVANAAFWETHGLRNCTPVAWLHDPDRILFAGGPDFAPLSAIWSVGISPETGRLTGPPRPITNGTGLETTAALASQKDGATRFVFSSRVVSQSIWALQLDSQDGLAPGEPVQLTSGTSDAQPRLSADGKKIFFNSFGCVYFRTTLH